MIIFIGKIKGIIQMRRLLLSFLTFFTIAVCFSQEEKPAGQNISVSINESMLNDFFQAIGTVKGKGKKGKTKYTWKVKKPKITIEPGSATFNAKVQIKVGKIKSSPKATGKLDVTYVKEENLIKIKTKKIKVDLTIKLLGTKVKLATLDLSKYYSPTFEFAGPALSQKTIEIDKPDGTKKILNIGTENQNLVVEQGKITVYADVIFTPQDNN